MYVTIESYKNQHDSFGTSFLISTNKKIPIPTQLENTKWLMIQENAIIGLKQEIEDSITEFPEDTEKQIKKDYIELINKWLMIQEDEEAKR